MRIPLQYRAIPIHRPFHLTAAREKAALGAVGSGKTLALVGDCLQFCFKQPGSTAMICRQTVPSLRDTTEAELVNMLTSPPDDWDGDDEDLVTLWDKCEVRRSGGHIDRIWLPGGSEIRFRSLDDWRKIMSYNLAYIAVDEANETDAETYLALLSRLRQSQPNSRARRLGVRWDPNKVRQQMALACNPDGHNWIWEYFIHNPTDDRRLFQSTTFDNPYLYNPDGSWSPFIKSLMTMPEIWIQRFVLGNPDVFAGQIYSLDPARHTHQHFDPPKDWDKGMGLDWGIRHPTALGWWCRKPGTTKWYKYREWQSYDPLDQGSRETAVSPSVDDIARTIKRLEGDEVIKWRAGDPIIWKREAGATEHQSVEYHFRKQGLYFQRGAKTYEDRINAVNLMLGRDDISIGSNCPMTLMAWQQYRWEDLAYARTDRDQPERPHKKNDHLVDCDQYFFTLFSQTIAPPIAPPQETKEVVMANWEQAIKNRIKEQVSRKR